jgi:hypothetical protein
MTATTTTTLSQLSIMGSHARGRQLVAHIHVIRLVCAPGFTT